MRRMHPLIPVVIVRNGRQLRGMGFSPVLDVAVPLTTKFASSATPWGAVGSVANLATTIVGGAYTMDLAKQQEAARAAEAARQQAALRAAQQAELTGTILSAAEKEAARRRTFLYAGGALGVIAVGVGIYFAYKAVRKR